MADSATQIVTYARYAETSGMTTTAASAQVSSNCSGNSATATRLKEARKIIFNGDSEAEGIFNGSADLTITMKNKKAECDDKGNNIFETYATKNELENYASKTELENFELENSKATEKITAACNVITELLEYFSNVKISVETIEGVPNLIFETGGKKYKFVGEEVSN